MAKLDTQLMTPATPNVAHSAHYCLVGWWYEPMAMAGLDAPATLATHD